MTMAPPLPMLSLLRDEGGTHPRVAGHLAAARSISGVRMARLSPRRPPRRPASDASMTTARPSAVTAASSSSHAVLQRTPPDGPVHRPGVNVAIPQRRGDRARDRPLADPRRTIDGDNHA